MEQQSLTFSILNTPDAHKTLRHAVQSSRFGDQHKIQNNLSSAKNKGTWSSGQPYLRCFCHTEKGPNPKGFKYSDI